MANFVNLNDIQNSKIFFDTNILIYILCPISNSKKNYTEKFSNYFKKIIKSNNEIYIDILIISEFVNRCLKIEESKYREEMKIKNFNFKKDFRNTEKYKEVIKSIYENLKVFF
jgi:predicted nucleic acid-binding protein